MRIRIIQLLHHGKDVIIPSERNGMVPYALQDMGFAISSVLALLLILSPTYFSISQLASLAEPFTFNAENVSQLINASRRAEGLPVLAKNTVLENASVQKVNDMLQAQYFAHISPQGKTPWDFLKQAGYYPYRAAGENLASDFLTAEDAHAALMASPTHRANIMNPLYTEIGVAVKQGTLHGQPTILIAQYFGKPKIAADAPRVARTGTSVPRTTSSATAPVAVAPMPIAPATNGEVLGVETPEAESRSEAQKIITRATKTFSYLQSRVSAVTGLRLFAFGALFVILLAFAFLIIRGGGLSLAIGLRTAIVLILFGYAASVGIHPWNYSEITATAASVTDVELTTYNAQPTTRFSRLFVIDR
jgi:uncharacterized protein YkwD